MNNVKYETKAAEGSTRCPVQLQRETPTGLIDTTCGSEVPPNYAGLCKYVLRPILILLLKFTYLSVLQLVSYMKQRTQRQLTLEKLEMAISK